jgi:hypothetical protein
MELTRRLVVHIHVSMKTHAAHHALQEEAVRPSPSGLAKPAAPERGDRYVDRVSITLEAQLGAEVRAAAQRADVSLSAWIAEAVADRLRHEAMGQALALWQAEDGPFTPTELLLAEETLAVGVAPRRAIRRRSARG